MNTATEKITNEFNSVQPHRAARNVMLLLERIEDFEARTLALRDDLDNEDRRALGWALRRLVQFIAPISPHLAEELWRAGGGDGFAAIAPWPIGATDPKER